MKLFTVYLKETSNVNQGYSQKFNVYWKQNHHCLLYCFLASFSWANISSLLADQFWSQGWDALGLREVSPEHKPLLYLWCPVQSAWDHSLHMDAIPQEPIQA